MKSNGRRSIRSGKEFDHLFPPPSGKDHRVKSNAGVEDTLKLIRQTVPKTLWQTEAIAKVLQGNTLRETCSNIWHFVYEHIQYKPDQIGVEQIRSPRRTWWERSTGVDCDCYSEFISSILYNLGIPHVLRITKYPKEPPEVPYWQHIYPIVPVSGKLGRPLRRSTDYITLDCVKDAFDEEQRFIEYKDYDMRLDYLDGIEDEGSDIEEDEDNAIDIALFGPEPDTVDAADIASVYDGEEMGNIFKKVGKAVKKVADVHKKVIKKTIDVHKTVAKKVADGHKKVIKAVAKKGIHFINRFTNPGTILLRNGFLLATKLNLFNIGGRLRYAYLTDAQAQERGINMDVLAKVRKIKDKAEKIYYDAGGNKSNFKKAVLKGRGNKKHNPVPMNGLGGFDDDIYADIEEYNIIHSDENNLSGLGEIAAGASIAAAMAAVGAVAGALKQVKGLFKKGGQEETSFQSETDNAGSVSEAKGNIPESEDEVRTDDGTEVSENTATDSSSWVSEVASNVSQAATAIEPVARMARSASNGSQPAPSLNIPAPAKAPISQPKYETPPAAEDTASVDTPSGAAIPGGAAIARSAAPDTGQPPENLPAVRGKETQGFVEKTKGWIKANPGKSIVIAGAIAGGGILLMRSFRQSKPATGQGLSGVPFGGRKRKHQKRKKSNQKAVKSKITFTKLL